MTNELKEQAKIVRRWEAQVIFLRKMSWIEIYLYATENYELELKKFEEMIASNEEIKAS